MGMKLDPELEQKVLELAGLAVTSAIPPDVTEKAFQAEVIRLAGMLGWIHYHTHDSRRSPAGFPDLVLLRERCVYAELKREGEKPTPQQIEWLGRLKNAGQEVYLWHPSDWTEIQRTLGRSP